MARLLAALLALFSLVATAESRFLLADAPRPLVNLLQQASNKLAMIAALPPLPTSLQTAQAFFCQGRLVRPRLMGSPEWGATR